MRYSVGSSTSPPFQFKAPDNNPINMKSDLRGLGVQLSADLSFSLQIEKAVTTANQMVGWGLRTFCSRSRHLMMVLLKSLVQPHLDYYSQMWSPSSQDQII